MVALVVGMGMCFYGTILVTTFAMMATITIMPLSIVSFIPFSHALAFDPSMHSRVAIMNFLAGRQQQQQQRGPYIFHGQSSSRATTSRVLLQSQGNNEEALNNNNNDNNNNTTSSADEEIDFQRRNQQWVVLVDDEESIRFSVGDFLYDRGYQVTACADANSLLDLIVSKNKASDDSDENNNNIQHRLPDIIISDVRMPESDKNGYELVEFLRSADTSIQATTSITQQALLDQRSLVSLKNVPIVLLTAKAMTADRIMGYKAGADVVLPKPFSPEELVSIIDNLIQRQHRWLQPRTNVIVSDPQSQLSQSQSQPSSNEEYRILKRELDEIKAIVQQNAAKTVQKTNIVLSDKERTIVELLAEGYTAREIASEVRPKSKTNSNSLSIEREEIATIRKIIDRLIETTETDSKTELIRWARRVGYIQQ
jgi:DNA-binding response OmpR family regulator